MKIKLADIPFEGRELAFELDVDALHSRVNSVRNNYPEGAILPPEYLFTAPPKVQVKLEAQNTTVIIKGKVNGRYQTPCSSCAEDIELNVSSDISFVLKPTSPGTPAEESEDTNFGSYDGEEIDCSEVVEESIILNLPHFPSCSLSSSGECPNLALRQKHLQTEEDDSGGGDERFAILKNLKIN